MTHVGGGAVVSHREDGVCTGVHLQGPLFVPQVVSVRLRANGGVVLLSCGCVVLWRWYRDVYSTPLSSEPEASRLPSGLKATPHRCVLHWWLL